MKNRIRITACFLIAALLLAVSGCGSRADSSAASDTSAAGASVAVSAIQTENYQLEEMVILSRHNIRSPLSDSSSTLGRMTTHTWYDWSSPASELSLRGGLQETAMGQYFRKYLISQGLIPENWMPEEGEARFYANSLQRTIATAQYFSSGLLPVVNVDVEYHEEFGTMDPVFNPQLTYVSDAFRDQVMEEINALDENGLDGVTAGLADAYKILEDVLDFKDSPYAEENGMTAFAPDDTEIILEENKEPAMTGSLKIACSAADALVLQYYEDGDALSAAFGETLTEDQWKALASIKTTYQTLLFGTYSLAVNTAHPLLEELESELTDDTRKFSYLCGHDSNLQGVLVALEAETPDLPDSLDSKTPIGSKLVFEKWLGQDGQEYVSLKLVYQTTEQLRGNAMLDEDDPPATVDVEVTGLTKNSDGLYLFDDLLARFDTAILAYDDLP